MKVAIMVYEDTMQRCTGSGCLNAFFNKIDSFARYEGQDDVELVSFTHGGGDLDKKIEMWRKKGVDVVHLSSCTRSKDENYVALAQKLSQDFAVVGYTHGDAVAKQGETMILAKAGTCE